MSKDILSVKRGVDKIDAKLVKLIRTRCALIGHCLPISEEEVKVLNGGQSPDERIAELAKENGLDPVTFCKLFDMIRTYSAATAINKHIQGFQIDLSPD